MELKLIKTKNLKKIKQLYKSAFPREEQIPFLIFRHYHKTNKLKTYILENEYKELLGFASIFIFKNNLLIHYLAVSKSFRSQGIGSIILTKLKGLYPTKKVIVEIETISNFSKNINQCKKRKKFYFNNKFEQCNYSISFNGQPLEILSYNGKVEAPEYWTIINNFYGKFVLKYIIKITLI